jgi:hypothetical protein
MTLGDDMRGVIVVTLLMLFGCHAQGSATLSAVLLDFEDTPVEGVDILFDAETAAALVPVGVVPAEAQ